MEGRIPILEYYSKATPLNGKYTEKSKQQIANAVFFALTPPLKAKKIQDMDREGRKPENIKILCQAMLETEHILSMLPQIEERRKASIEKQIAHQEVGLSDPSTTLERFHHINRHTLVNELYKHSSDIENKFQISFMPFPEDEELLPEESQSEPKYYAIKQQISEKGGSQYNPHPKIIEYSVYDIKKIPLELIDFALHGEAKLRYNGEEEGQLLMKGADNIDTIKQCLMNAHPLQYDRPKETDIADYTQRIMSLSHGNKKLYMLSENTPMVYEEKGRRAYTNTNIRYTFFTDKDQLIYHLGYQLPNTSNKIMQFKELLQFLPISKDVLVQTYGDEELFITFAQMIEVFKEKIIGQTKLEQSLRAYLKSIHYKNAISDWMVFKAMKAQIEKGMKDQETKVEYMHRHIESLQRDARF